MEPENASEDFNLEEELDKFSDDLLELEDVSKNILSNYLFFNFTKKKLKLLFFFVKLKFFLFSGCCGLPM